MAIRTTSHLRQPGRCSECGELPRTHAALTHDFVESAPVDLGLVAAIYSRCSEPDMRSIWNASPNYRLRQYEDLTDQVCAMIDEITRLRAALDASSKV